MNKNIEDLNKLLQDFLKDNNRRSGCGYAEVKKEDIESLWEIFYLIIRLKFEKDCDGDLPIELQIANRHHERFIYPCKVQYEGKNKLRALSNAISSIAEELNHAYLQFEYEHEQETK